LQYRCKPVTGRAVCSSSLKTTGNVNCLRFSYRNTLQCIECIVWTKTGSLECECWQTFILPYTIYRYVEV